VPITFLLADALDIEPIPLVIIEVVASNIRGTAILIADPPNIIIAGATGLSFDAFIVNLAPIAAIALVAITAVLYLSYRPRLRVEPRARRRLMDLDAARLIEDRDELIRTVPLLVATILVFFLHRALGLEPATVALAGATAMMLVTRQPLDEALAGIEWRKLFFFLGRGLFVMVGALEETGAIRELADGIATLTDGDRTAELRGIAWASALGSGLSTTSPSPPRWSPPWSSCRNATPATTPTGGRSRSAPASAATPG
jgi:Na+/H+ antiporter NhaD/arsenite permease-like protein